MTQRSDPRQAGWDESDLRPGTDDDDQYDDEPDHRGRGGKTAGVVFLALALIGSVAFALYAVTVRDASQIPLLAAGAVVLGIVFAVLALFAIRATWRAGIDARNGQSLVLGVGGGIAAIIAAGCIAGAIILFLLSQGA